MKQDVFLSVVFTEAFALWHAHLGENTLETLQGRMPPYKGRMQMVAEIPLVA